jgi:UDP-N-acetylmuramate dehydrogenase
MTVPDSYAVEVVPAPPFSELTTLRVGGAPERLVQPSTTDQLIDVARAVWARGGEWLLIAGGSNTVVSDDGFEGTAIRIATRGIEVLPSDGSRSGRVGLRVQSGEPWDGVVNLAVRHGWSGIESLSGIPGSAGAAPMQNIGAYGQEVADALVAVDFLDYETGEVQRIAASELGLGYRTSVLKRGLRGIVLSVELELVDANEPLGAPLSRPVEYAQLADSLGVPTGARVSLAELRRTVLALRSSKGMLLDDSDPDSVSAGSFFTNPIVRENFARSLPADAPRWPVEPEEPDLVIALGSEPPAPEELRWAREDPDEPASGGSPRVRGSLGSAGPYLVKLSAAWLIESAGIRKGFAIPGSRAAISDKHTLALTNRGGATAAEVAQLATFVQSRVQSEFGLVLQPEPVLVGLEL